MRHRFVLLAAAAFVGGCVSSLNTDLTESPADWSPYVGRTVTLHGNAGNSPQGAIVRMDDNGYIPLRTREKWGIDAVGRPVIVTGTIVGGEGFRAEKYVIQADKVEVPPPDQSAQNKGLSGL